MTKTSATWPSSAEKKEERAEGSGWEGTGALWSLGCAGAELLPPLTVLSPEHTAPSLSSGHVLPPKDYRQKITVLVDH